MLCRRDRIDDFSKLYYQACSYSKLAWRGVDLLQYPTDLFVWADLIHRVRPEVIVETGTFQGGFALFCADVLHANGLDDSTVITVDVNDWSGSGGYPEHPEVHIAYVRGSSTDPAVVRKVATGCQGLTTMVVLDSDHSEGHVLAELAAYAPMVSVGSYLLVQDTNVHQVREYGPGPDDALAAWLPTRTGQKFQRDHSCERLMLTACPGGWLRRVR